MGTSKSKQKQSVYGFRLEKFLSDSQVNQKYLEWLKADERLTAIAKAVTHFAFRNGPVEGMHAAGKLSEEDMMILNKFMVNRLAYVFQIILKERWAEFGLLVEVHDQFYGHGWDAAIPDDGDMKAVLDFIYEDTVKEMRKRPH